MKTGVCKMCGTEFSSFIAEQRHCSACNDIRSGQQSIAVEHETLNEWPIILGFSPEWKPCGPLFGWAYVHKGRDYGPVWAGRFTLYSPFDQPRAGDRVLLQQRQSVHLVRVRKENCFRYDYEMKHIVRYEKNTYLSIARGVSREQLMKWIGLARGGKFIRIELPDGTLITTEARQYYVLFPANTEPEYRLVTVDTKPSANGIVLEAVEGHDPNGRFSFTTHYALISL